MLKEQHLQQINRALMADKGTFKGFSLLCFVSGAWLVAGKKNTAQMWLCASASSVGKAETLEATQSEFIMLNSKMLLLQSK